MMINFGSLVQIGIRDNSLKLCEKERKKKKYFSFSMRPNERKKNTFSHNLSELSLIPIWTREPKFIIMLFFIYRLRSRIYKIISSEINLNKQIKIF